MSAGNWALGDVGCGMWAVRNCIKNMYIWGEMDASQILDTVRSSHVSSCGVGCLLSAVSSHYGIMAAAAAGATV
jgi:hypothetical protein